VPDDDGEAAVEDAEDEGVDDREAGLEVLPDEDLDEEAVDGDLDAGILIGDDLEEGSGSKTSG
jgi:hypothetical protein